MLTSINSQSTRAELGPEQQDDGGQHQHDHVPLRREAVVLEGVVEEVEDREEREEGCEYLRTCGESGLFDGKALASEQEQDEPATGAEDGVNQGGERGG